MIFWTSCRLAEAGNDEGDRNDEVNSRTEFFIEKLLVGEKPGLSDAP
ncbi:hypothetical protein QCE47_26220 [Caballeronia sp. LZ025]|nr:MULTISPECIES: hypothetical protein [Caballeronia]MDR5735822.1 hypothetical protein [Caballeronia sp. LZ025]